jgi:glycerol-3-phosphate dehydrogenase (NAD(P)+)
VKIGLIGSGSWGTALAKMLTDNGHDLLWCVRSSAVADHIRKRHHNPRYLSSVYFGQDNLMLTSDPAEVYAQASVAVLAVPSAYVEQYILPYHQKWSADLCIVSAVKGMMPGKNCLINDYLHAELNVDPGRYVTIMGPCHAEEVAAEKLSYLTFAGVDQGLTSSIASLFSSAYLNTIVSHDVKGVQYAAVLKNIYALGAGIAHGLGYGDNFLSVLIANAAGELKRFLTRVCSSTKNAIDPIESIDYAASVYLGDLLVTCYSLFSRNRAFGNLIGKGYAVDAAKQDMHMVAEGYPASKTLFELNKDYAINMPIAHTVYSILWEGTDPRSAFEKLEASLR